VFPCRLPARKPGGGRAEIFLLSETGPNLWHALVKGGGAARRRLSVTADIEAELINEGPDGAWSVRFHGVSNIRELLPSIGKTPLPPYIKREPSGTDRERYQTVYAAREGAVAAPTAGLHFTPDLLERLDARGVEFAFVTLHVGPGTFQPVRADLVADHRMPPERYEISRDAAGAVNRAKSEGRRIIAVGTTSVRAIETAASGRGTVVHGEGASGLFIYPGYRFKVTDGIVTNFHLPKSTLLMLVSAFEGRDRILSAYRTAVAEKYRFYSYGDAMLIL
jgi:S-adenosylmethionine:tRNA ribosyltransferase-isomerase